MSPRASVLTRCALLSLLALAAGCRRNKAAPGDLTGTLTVGDRARTYLYHVPGTLDPAKKPWPLVVALHGRFGDGVSQERLSGFTPLADKEGFLVVYPDGVDRSWNDGRPGSPAAEQGVDDVGFLSALIDVFVKDHGADPARVFVTGMSNGAMMTQRLGCDLSEKVAAIGAVAGLLSVGTAKTCAPKRPVPAILFFGTEDPLMPYGGGSVGSDVGGDVLSANDNRKKWADLDGCTDSPSPVALPDTDASDGTTVTRTAHGACKEGSEVILYSVEHGGHTWPNGPQYLGERIIGKTTHDIDASALSWAFFQKHPKK